MFAIDKLCLRNSPVPKAAASFNINGKPSTEDSK